MSCPVHRHDAHPTKPGDAPKASLARLIFPPPFLTRADATSREERLKVQFPDGVEREYRRALHRRLDKLHALVMRRIDPVLSRIGPELDERARELGRADATPDQHAKVFTQAINGARLVFGREYPVEHAKTDVERAGKQTSQHNAEQVKKSFKQVLAIDPVLGNRGLKEKLVSFESKNLRLIKDVDEQYLRQVEGKVVDAVRRGVRHEEFADIIEDRLGVAQSRAKLIARDQIGSLNGELTSQRHQELGVSRFMWMTADDERVRDLHDLLGEQIFEYSDPPSEGVPGQPINCRCWARPMISDLI